MPVVSHFCGFGPARCSPLVSKCLCCAKLTGCCQMLKGRLCRIYNKLRGSKTLNTVFWWRPDNDRGCSPKCERARSHQSVCISSEDRDVFTILYWAASRQLGRPFRSSVRGFRQKAVNWGSVLQPWRGGGHSWLCCVPPPAAWQFWLTLVWRG